MALVTADDHAASKKNANDKLCDGLRAGFESLTLNGTDQEPEFVFSFDTEETLNEFGEERLKVESSSPTRPKRRQSSISIRLDPTAYVRLSTSPGDKPRLRISEAADVSQVLQIHNFQAPNQPTQAWKPTQKVGLDCFDVVSVIGKGAYGKVFLVRKKILQENSKLYAMKVLRKASIVVHGKGAEHTKNERNILEDVQHPFIVTLHYAFQTEAKLYLILGYASGGELFSYLAQEKMFSEDVARFYIAELLLAVEHLHDLGIIYRDLKPENVLLNANGHILLTDFGLSKVALGAETVCGTIEFMAPEVLDDHRKEGYDKAVDYWSLGVMLFDMLTGNPPFYGHNRKKIMDAILTKKVVCPKFMTSFAQDLCLKLLKKDPKKRLGSGDNGAKQVKSHSFFRKTNWEQLARLEVTPPLIPNLTSPEDTSYFDNHFTAMGLAESPSDTSVQTLGDEHIDHFLGFSYVAESYLAREFPSTPKHTDGFQQR
ncbi:kinase-like domain-containing protein [Phlyctochytrium arcticum]|nr:kinase-like domain-containing protein [Phlyctochytrium arcticum]